MQNTLLTAAEPVVSASPGAELSPNAEDSSIKQSVAAKSRGSSMALLGAIVLASVACGFLAANSSLFNSPQLKIVNASFVGDPVTDGVSVEARLPEAAESSAEQMPNSRADTETLKQLGLLRAELLRLHTQFVRLAELAELDDGEFDLESPLLDWQEQSNLEQIGLLNRRIAHMSDSARVMQTIFNIRRIAYDQKISGKPLVEGHRTSGFGFRADPMTGERLEHLGLDFSGPVGEPILALADGIVTFSGKNAGYGNMVELEHVDGFRTRYAHNQANLVSTGARVSKGEPIATLGSTGRSTGPHVHVEVRLDGSPIDPAFFVR